MREIIGVCVVAVFAAGCGSSAPGCSAEKTQSLVKQIVREQLSNDPSVRAVGLDVTKGQMSLDAIRTQSVDQKTGKVECAANLTLIPEKPVLGFPKQLQWPIQYTSELTDKAGEFYVTVILGNQ